MTGGETQGSRVSCGLTVVRWGEGQGKGKGKGGGKEGEGSGAGSMGGAHHILRTGMGMFSEGCREII